MEALGYPRVKALTGAVAAAAALLAFAMAPVARGATPTGADAVAWTGGPAAMSAVNGAEAIVNAVQAASAHVELSMPAAVAPAGPAVSAAAPAESQAPASGGAPAVAPRPSAGGPTPPPDPSSASANVTDRSHRTLTAVNGTGVPGPAPSPVGSPSHPRTTTLASDRETTPSTPPVGDRGPMVSDATAPTADPHLSVPTAISGDLGSIAPAAIPGDIGSIAAAAIPGDIGSIAPAAGAMRALTAALGLSTLPAPDAGIEGAAGLVLGGLPLVVLTLPQPASGLAAGTWPLGPAWVALPGISPQAPGAEVLERAGAPGPPDLLQTLFGHQPPGTDGSGAPIGARRARGHRSALDAPTSPPLDPVDASRPDGVLRAPAAPGQTLPVHRPKPLPHRGISPRPASSPADAVQPSLTLPLTGGAQSAAGTGTGLGATAALLLAVLALLLLQILSNRMSLELSAWRSTPLVLRLERPG